MAGLHRVLALLNMRCVCKCYLRHDAHWRGWHRDPRVACPDRPDALLPNHPINERYGIHEWLLSYMDDGNAPWVRRMVV